MVWLGCFLSSSKGYEWMGNTALSMGADTFQYFTRNPRGGKVKALDLEDVSKLSAMQADGRLGPIVAHAPYTINPCSATDRTREFALETMTDDLPPPLFSSSSLPPLKSPSPVTSSLPPLPFPP